MWHPPSLCNCMMMKLSTLISTNTTDVHRQDLLKRCPTILKHQSSENTVYIHQLTFLFMIFYCSTCKRQSIGLYVPDGWSTIDPEVLLLELQSSSSPTAQIFHIFNLFSFPPPPLRDPSPIPESHAIEVGDWLIWTLMDWIQFRIFFWCPANVIPILRRSLKRQNNISEILYK